MTAAAASGDTLTGTVRDAAGAPVAGAMVSAVQPKLRRATTVYSDERGAFSIPGLEAGLYDVRVRRIGYQDLLQSGVDIGNAPASLDVRVEAETDPQALAWQLPASRWRRCCWQSCRATRTAKSSCASARSAINKAAGRHESRAAAPTGTRSSR